MQSTFYPYCFPIETGVNLGVVAKGKHFPSIKDLSCMVTTFCFTVFAWIFFRIG